MNKKKIKVGYQPNKINEPTFFKPPSTGSGIGMNPSPKCEKTQGISRLPKKSNIELLKELLNNPRIEAITINIARVGNVEETNINAKLKESRD